MKFKWCLACSISHKWRRRYPICQPKTYRASGHRKIYVECRRPPKPHTNSLLGGFRPQNPRRKLQTVQRGDKPASDHPQGHRKLDRGRLTFTERQTQREREYGKSVSRDASEGCGTRGLKRHPTIEKRMPDYPRVNGNTTSHIKRESRESQ